MAYSYTKYTGNGNLSLFSVPFPYIRSAHVKALVDGVAITPTFINSSQISLTPAPAAGAQIIVFRQTPIEPLVTFASNAILTEKELNLANTQALYLLQEQADELESAGLIATDNAETQLRIDNLTNIINSLQQTVNNLANAGTAPTALAGEVKVFLKENLPAGWQPIFENQNPNVFGATTLYAQTVDGSTVPNAGSGELVAARRGDETEYTSLNSIAATSKVLALGTFNQIVGGTAQVSAPISTGSTDYWLLRAFVNNQTFFSANGTRSNSTGSCKGLWAYDWDTETRTFLSPLDFVNPADTVSIYQLAGNSDYRRGGDLNTALKEVQFYANYLFSGTGVSTAWDLLAYVRYNYETGTHQATAIAVNDQAALDFLNANAADFPGITNLEDCIVVPNFADNAITALSQFRVYDSRFAVSFKLSNGSYDNNVKSNTSASIGNVSLVKINQLGQPIDVLDTGIHNDNRNIVATNDAVGVVVGNATTTPANGASQWYVIKDNSIGVVSPIDAEITFGYYQASTSLEVFTSTGTNRVYMANDEGMGVFTTNSISGEQPAFSGAFVTAYKT